jgi:hypothetical protein
MAVIFLCQVLPALRLLSELSKARSQLRRLLRWRSQFAPQPTCRFDGFKRIDKGDHLLMNVIAGGALKCPDVKARETDDVGQHRSCLARRAKWSQDDHVLRLGSGGSVTELSVTISCRYGTVMKLSCASDLGARGQYCSFIKISRIGTGFPQARPEPSPSMKLVCVLRDAHGVRRMTAPASRAEAVSLVPGSLLLVFYHGLLM